MKKVMAVCLAILAMGLVFGQASDPGSIFIDPLSWSTFESFNGSFTIGLPMSMICFASSGLWRDELDQVVLNPMSLSDYKGYTIWTAYGNYNVLFGGETPNYPFSTTSPTISEIQAGIGMPVPLVPAWRMGLLLGNQVTRTGRIDIAGPVDAAVLELNRIQIYDVAAPSGTPSYTVSENYKIQDEQYRSIFRLGAGVDLGFMGISLYALGNNTQRTVGGEYEYTWVKGSDTFAPTNQDTMRRILAGTSVFGTDVAGTEAKGSPSDWNNSTNWLFGAIGQLPFTLFGISMPLSAKLGFDYFSGADGIDLPVRYFRNTDYVGGVSGESSTYTWTGSQTINGAWDPVATIINTVTAGAYAYEPATVVDPSKTGKGYFAVNLGGWINPVIKLDPTLTLLPSAGLDYHMAFYSKNSRTAAFSQASIADGGALANNTWSFADDTVVASGGMGNYFNFKLGSMAEFKTTDSFLTLGIGLFTHPYIYLLAESVSSWERTISRSWVDTAAVDDTTYAALAALASHQVRASAIGQGVDFEGTSDYSETRTYTGSAMTNTLGIRITLPVSAKFSFFKGKLLLITSYVIANENSATYNQTGTYVSTESLVVKNSAGATIYDTGFVGGDPTAAAAAPSANSVTEYGSGNWTVASTPWSGQMMFMLRWMPVEALTIDFEGQSIITAFQAMDNMLSLNNGINISSLWNAVNSLTLSATFHF